MRGLFFFALLIASINCKSQCTECTSLNEAFKNPNKVISLQFNGFQSGIRLDSLPSTVGLLINVEILFISDHNIKIIPKEIGNLKKLKELSFAGCQLEYLPEEIFTLTNLKELVLFDNQFSDETKKALKVKFKDFLPKTRILM